MTWAGDVPTCSSLNFKDKDHELSVNLADEATPDQALAGHEGFGLVQITAGQIRDACGAEIKICRCTEEPDLGHVLVCGKVSGGMAKRMQKAAVWVEGRLPTRDPPAPSQPVAPAG